MAIVSTITGTAAVLKSTGAVGGIRKLFGGGGNFAQQNRNRKREELQSVGFNWRKTSGVPRGEEWNIDNYSDRALDNLARLYDNYGEIAVELHNNRKISNSTVAENYESIQQLALQKQRAESGGRSEGGIVNGVDTKQVINAGTGVLTALAISGGLFYLISKG